MKEQTALIKSLTTLHEELSSLTATSQQEAIALNQAFDRLMMGYQNGEYDESLVESGISEIRSMLRNMHQPAALMPNHTGNLRDTTMARNSRSLTEKLLSDDRGTWDSRHVEIVQGAIQQLAKSGESDAVSIASMLQKRMSDSIWLGNLELAETRAEVEAESQSLKNDLIATLNARQAALETVPFDAPDTERVLAVEPEKTVDSAISKARFNTIRAQMQAEARDLKVSKEYVESLAGQIPADNSEAIARATESLRDASKHLIESEYAKLGKIYKGVIATLHEVMDAETGSSLISGIESAVAADIGDSAQVQSHMDSVRAILRPIVANHPELRNAMHDLDRIQWRTSMLKNIASDADQAKTEKPAATTAQLLDARMMFEQKRMQFERNPEYQIAAPELMKALDFEIEKPAYASRPTAANAVIDNSIKRIREIAQSEASGDIGMYAPVAGAEFARNATPALHLADQKTPTVSFIPTIQSALAHRSNRAMRDVRQLAYQPSVRSDMGFATPRYKMDAAQQPLFKRIRFNQNNAEANALLPALYKVSGIKVKSDQKTDKPLRKSLFGLNLSAANFEVIKIIENQFKPTGQGTVQTVGDANENASQSIHRIQNEHDRVAGLLSDWLEKRQDMKTRSAEATDLIQTGRMAEGNVESRIKSEGELLPASVQQKLAPFLGFDLSRVRIYSGPVASMAADAMGAHAFTLGTNIFLGRNKLNYDTPEGLGLLAHEILHTSHFSAPGSVDSKEQAAESMEERVKKAFGTTVDRFLALEENFDKTTAAPNLSRASDEDIAPDSVGARFAYDPDEVYDAVCEKVLELMTDSFNTEKERQGKE